MKASHLAAGAFLVIAATVVQGSRVQGRVTDADGTPLRDAYVWVADADDVQLRLRTDATGRFHAWHRPFALREGAMLVCAPGHSTMVTTGITRAWIAEYGIGVWPENSPRPPAPSAEWAFDAPADCAQRTVRAAS